MRQYEPIWLQIKDKHKATLTASPDVHRRIILAVRKEKTKDVGWKLLQLEQKKRYRLKEKIEGEIITFYLVEAEPLNYATLSASDL